jgi:hypothetical protein
MPAGFPSSPSTNDRHTIGDKTWEWNGSVWNLVERSNIIKFSGDSDSTVAELNLVHSEEFRIVGDDSNITTTVSAGDSANSTLRISLNSDISVTSITADTLNVSLNGLSDVDAQSGDKQDGDVMIVNDDSSNTFTLSGKLTTAMRLPSGNTAARPTAYAGAIRYNSQTQNFEVCEDGSSFVALRTEGTATITKDQYTGDGDTANFTLTGTPADQNNIIVYVDGVMQEPGENYTVSGTLLSFTASGGDGEVDSSTQEAPHSGARIVVMRGFDTV